MIKQLFKIMWHRKGKNFLLLTEIFFSFLVLFATVTFLAEALSNYLAPIGFDYSDVYELDLEYHGEERQTVQAKMQTIRQLLKNRPEVAHYSLASENTPFSYSFMNDGFSIDEKTFHPAFYVVDPAYFETMDLQLKEGRWLNEADIVAVNKKPIVINEHLSEGLFAGENALGKVLKKKYKEHEEFEIVGVVKHFRHDGEFASPENSLFMVLTNRIRLYTS